MCGKFLVEWFNQFKGIKAYFRDKTEEARRYGYVREDFYGRIRQIPEMRSSQKFVQEAGARQACSMAIQGAAQQIMKKAMADMIPAYKAYRQGGVVCNPLIQIHDDLMWEVSDEIVEEFVPLLMDTMTSSIKMCVPLRCEAKVGKDWGNMEVWK